MKKSIRLLSFLLAMLFPFACVYARDEKNLASRAIDVIVDGELFSGVNIYRISEQTNYFSAKEIADVYDGRLSWKPISSQVVMNFNNRKINIKANSGDVVFEGENKKMFFPSRLIKNDMYISPEIITSKDFAKIVEADTKWNPESLVLSITRNPNISALKYLTKIESTLVLIHLERPLYYTVLKTPEAVIIKMLNGRIQKGFMSVNNSVINDIVYSTKGRFAIVRINLSQIPKFVKASTLKKSNVISIDIIHSKNVDVSTSKGTTFIGQKKENVSSIEKNDLVPAEEYREAQVIETLSLVDDDKSNEDLENVPVVNFCQDSIVEEGSNLIIVDNNATAMSSTAIKQGDHNSVGTNGENKESSNKARKIILLDAGHGGNDPGAIGPNGIKEKDINLAIIQELKRIFDRDSNYKVILTRKDDTFIPLSERTNIANKNSANLFISVHCNANFDRSVSGFEIYFLSEKATDSEAAATAILENSVLKLEERSRKKNSLIKNILGSMALNEYVNESSELCGFIADEAQSKLKILNRGVKQASFYVLRGARMPAVLVESAFLSNCEQETKLNSKEFQSAVANSVYHGVVKYYARKNGR
jgi:N-acetylmuramoyl-L-alanine amidase